MNITQTKDCEVITKLNESVHTLHYRLYPTRFKPYDYQSIKEFFKSIVDIPNFQFLLLEEEKQPIGYAWIEFRSYPETVFTKSLEVVYVHQISINSTARNKGFGSKLMLEIEQIAKNHCIDVIELDYWAANQKAKDFYTKNGFQINREYDSTHSDTYGDQEAAAFNTHYGTVGFHPLVAFDGVTGDFLKAKLCRWFNYHAYHWSHSSTCKS
jgi:ribosomal protein S18 acetylase RimI-like enzyme